MIFTICINTRDDLEPKQHASLLARSLLNTAPSLIMQRINNYEPIRHIVGDDIQAELERFWAYPVLWTRRSPQVEGSVWFGNRRNHSGIVIKPTCPISLIDQFDAFIRDVATWLTIDLAYIYYCYDEELKGPKYDESAYAMSLGIATQDMKRGIPDLAWRTYFGQVYAEVIGRGRLLSCPADKVEEAEGGLIAVTLTSRAGGSYAEYESARHTAKTHIGLDVFWPREPQEPELPRRVPAFDFGPHPSPGLRGAASR